MHIQLLMTYTMTCTMTCGHRQIYTDSSRVYLLRLHLFPRLETFKARLYFSCRFLNLRIVQIDIDLFIIAVGLRLGLSHGLWRGDRILALNINTEIKLSLANSSKALCCWAVKSGTWVSKAHKHMVKRSSAIIIETVIHANPLK